eukprot:17492-Rhodomonas_salina.2
MEFAAVKALGCYQLFQQGCAELECAGTETRRGNGFLWRAAALAGGCSFTARVIDGHCSLDRAPFTAPVPQTILPVLAILWHNGRTETGPQALILGSPTAHAPRGVIFSA